MPHENIIIRPEIKQSDLSAIRRIIESTGFFYPEEVEVAVDLALDRLEYGKDSSYSFLFAESNGKVSGYTCYGPIACTYGSFDLYWIAVDTEFQGTGIGRLLMEETEKAAVCMGCRRIYIETSARELYQPTQKFYLKAGYIQEAVLEDYYAPNDAKIIYVKALAPITPVRA